MALSSADLQLIISATDNMSGPLAGMREAIASLSTSVTALAEKAGGVGGGLTKLGTDAEGAGRQVQEASGMFDGMSKSLGEVGKVIGAFALGSVVFSAAEGVKTLFESVETLGHSTHQLQMEIGGSAEQVSGMLAVFERWGVTNEQAAVSLGILSKNITQYNDESQKAQSAATGMSGAVDRLGLTLKDASGASVSANDALLQIADRFARMPDGVEKTADAMALFGRSGRDMIPVLDQGRAGIQAAMDTAKQYGLVLSQDNVEAVYKFGQAQRDLSEAVKGFAVQVGILVLPALTSLVQGVTSMAETFNTTVLPPIRAVVEYVSNNFGPYIAAGVALAGEAFNSLAGVVSGALGDVLSIVSSVGQAIADALSWLNPFAEHSPSLVSQVRDGMDAISTAYAGSAASLKSSISDVKDQLAGVTDALKDAQSQLTNWGKTPIEGTKAFQDQLDAIDTKSNQVRLAIDQIKLGHDITPQLEALNAQLKQVELQTVPKGGSAAHTAQVKGIEEQIQALKTGGAQGDLKALEDQLKNLGLQADAVKLTEKLQLDPLQKQLKEIANPTLAEKPFKEIAAGLQAAREQVTILTPEQTKLNDILKAQQAALSDIGAAAHVAAGGHAALAGAAANIASPFKDANQAITTAKETISDWGAKVSEARTRIETFTGGIATAVTSFPGVTDFFKNIKGAIGDLGDFIKGHGLNFGDLFANVSGAGADVGKILGTVGSGLLDALKKVFGSISWPDVWKAAGDIGNGILSTAGGLLDSVVGWLKGVWSGLSAKWPEIWAKAGDIGSGLITAGGDILTRVEGWLKDTWGRVHWIDVWAKAQDIGNGIAVAGATFLTTVEKWLKDTWSKIDWAPIWASVTGSTKGFTEWLTTMDTTAITAKMKDFRTTVEPISGVLSVLSGIIAIVTTALVANAVATLAEQVALTALSAAAGIAETTMTLFKLALATDPIVAATLAIIALTTALTVLYNTNNTARTQMDAAWKGIQDKIDTVGKDIHNITRTMITDIDAVATALTNLIQLKGTAGQKTGSDLLNPGSKGGGDLLGLGSAANSVIGSISKPSSGNESAANVTHNINVNVTAPNNDLKTQAQAGVMDALKAAGLH